ncbi:MAG: hypothetical protein SVR04_10550 [Spirochaetota bacterium]|nr:hypothetical protein [Spirochaetota bacterium]
MGRGGYSFAVLLQFLEDSIKDFPDIRTGKNTVYEVRDAVLSAFSVFFMQGPSFLAHQKAMGRRKGKNNAQSIFGVHKIPTDKQIRSLLDPVSPELLFPVFDRIFEFLVREGIIRDMVTEDARQPLKQSAVLSMCVKHHPINTYMNGLMSSHRRNCMNTMIRSGMERSVWSSGTGTVTGCR